MLIKKKQFLLGMLIGLFPVLLYANFRLNPTNLLHDKNENPSFKQSSTITENSFVLMDTGTPTPDYQIVSFIQSPSKENIVPTKTPTAIPTAFPSPTPILVAKADIPQSDFDALIDQYAVSAGVDSRIMKIIAKCESGFRPNATNGPYAGMYQFISSTWISNRRAMGEDPNPDLRFNAEEAIKTAAYKMGRDGYSAWPVCSRIAFAQLTPR